MAHVSVAVKPGDKLKLLEKKGLIPLYEIGSSDNYSFMNYRVVAKVVEAKRFIRVKIVKAPTGEGTLRIVKPGEEYEIHPENYFDVELIRRSWKKEEGK